MSEATALTVTEEDQKAVTVKDDSVPADPAFEHAKRQAIALSKSDIIPKGFQGNVANCLVALEYAQRLGCPPMALMQNLYVVQGKPSLSGTFLLAMIRQHYTGVRFEWVGEQGRDSWGCRLIVDNPEGGDPLRGTTITMAMAKAESWGPKWKTMPEQMLQYRAAAFWSRVFASHLTLGLHIVDEMADVRDRRTAPVDDLNAALDVTPRRVADENEAPESTDPDYEVEQGSVL